MDSSSGAEELCGSRLAFQEFLPEALRECAHGLDRVDVIAEVSFSGLPDKAQVMLRIHFQPLENWRE